MFIYQTCEDGVRHRIAKLYGVDVDRVRCHLMGDLRHVRNDIIRDQGRVFINHKLPFLSQFWKVEGDERKFLGEDYVEAYVPVTLPGALSEPPGVLSAREIIPPQEDR